MGGVVDVQYVCIKRNSGEESNATLLRLQAAASNDTLCSGNLRYCLVKVHMYGRMGGVCGRIKQPTGTVRTVPKDSSTFGSERTSGGVDVFFLP